MKKQIKIALALSLSFVFIANDIVYASTSDVVNLESEVIEQTVFAGSNSIIKESLDSINNTLVKTKKLNIENEVKSNKKKAIERNNIEVYEKGYTTNKIELRKKKKESSEIVKICSNINTKVNYYIDDENWCKVKYDGEEGYVTKDYISNKKIESKEYKINSANYSGKKTWMGYKAVTKTTSPQYKLLRNKAITNEDGFRMVNGRYCVALGSRFTETIGQYVDIVLENGTVIPAILGDGKANCHTDSTNTFTTVNNTWCCTEFIVDSTIFKSHFKGIGDTSLCYKNWDSKVEKIIVYDFFEEID